MKYTIISIDDSRAASKQTIRTVMRNFDEETNIKFVNGRDASERAKAFAENPRIVPTNWVPRVGEVGVWFSQMNCWKWAAENGPLIVFEDDAIVLPSFENTLSRWLPQLPEDYDFLSLFVPDNQRVIPRVIYDENGIPKNHILAGMTHNFDYGADELCMVYQGYSMVATLYSSRGAQKMLALANEFGMYTPVDCFIFLQAHRGALNGYAPKPESLRPVLYNWNNHIHTTLVHLTEELK